jgi:hypothetical protein
MILITTAGKVGSQAARLLERDTRGVALPFIDRELAADALVIQPRTRRSRWR